MGPILDVVGWMGELCGVLHTQAEFKFVDCREVKWAGPLRKI